MIFLELFSSQSTLKPYTAQIQSSVETILFALFHNAIAAASSRIGELELNGNLGSNIGVPLKAICILERGEENAIRSIRPQEALPMLMQQSQRPQKPHNFPKYLDLIDQLTGKVAFYRMACNMDPQAALVAYRSMHGEGKDE